MATARNENATEAKKPLYKVLATSGLVRQYYATFSICLALFGAGGSSGWASPMLMVLKSDNSPVGKMTLNELGLVESLPTIAGILGMFVYGTLLDRLGRKTTGYLAAIPSVVGWVFLVLAYEPYHIYIGRGCVGIASVGIVSVAPVYLAEAVEDKHRGTLLTCTLVAANLAMLYSNILGSVLEYRMFNSLCLIAPALFPLSFYWLPDSPYYFAYKGDYKKLEESLIWLRGNDKKVVSEEMKKIAKVKMNKKGIVNLFRQNSTRRAMLIIVFLFVFQQLGGNSIVQGYASVIFEDTNGVNLSPNASAIILMVLKIGALFVGTIIIDRVGRRTLLINSFLVMGISLIVVSTYFYVQQVGINVVPYSPIPLVALCVYNIAFSMGVAIVPEVIANEVLPPEVKGASSMISGTATLTVITGMLQSYPYLREYFGTFSNFAYTAVVNFIGALITCYFLPETRNKSIAEIIANLGKPRMEL